MGGYLKLESPKLNDISAFYSKARTEKLIKQKRLNQAATIWTKTDKAQQHDSYHWKTIIILPSKQLQQTLCFLGDFGKCQMHDQNPCLKEKNYH